MTPRNEFYRGYQRDSREQKKLKESALAKEDMLHLFGPLVEI